MNSLNPNSNGGSPLLATNPFLVLKMAWGAILITQLTLLAAVGPVVEKASAGAVPEGNVLLPALIMIAAMEVLLAMFVPPILARAALKRNPPLVPTGDPLDWPALVRRLFQPFVVRLALFESISVIGFVAAIVQRSTEIFYPFLAVGIIMQVLTPPTEKTLRRWLK